MHRKLILILIAAGLVLLSAQGFAGSKSAELPKGTKVEQLDPKHFKFALPNGNVIEVKNFDPKTNIIEGSFKIIVGEPVKKGVISDSGKTGIIGDCGIFDRSRTMIDSGIKPVIQSGPKPQGNLLKLSEKDFIKIGDTIVYLPATLLFMPEEKKEHPEPRQHVTPEGKQ
jgi:hypothetical protein